jgi:ATP-dependent exoDNAse (exonuclease V) alpha subunit
MGVSWEQMNDVERRQAIDEEKEKLRREDVIARIAGADTHKKQPGLFDVGPIVAPPILVTLNPDQHAAVEAIIAWRFDTHAPRVLALTGPAGTGKSTIMRAVAARLRGTRTAWAAMTGKAASRLKEAAGVRGKTLHSVIYHQPREVDNVIEKKIDLEFDDVRDADEMCLLSIDESSMISPKIDADIKRTSYEKVLLVGDPYQIPPVLTKTEEAEQGSDDYSVFTGVAGPHLSQVMRAQGAVLRAATHVRELQQIPTESIEEGGSKYTYEVTNNPTEALHTAVAMWFEDPKDHVLITWRNEPRMEANQILRAALDFDDPLPQPGEPLVVCKNSYKSGLMNGDVLRVEGWEDDGPTLCGIETRYVRVRTQLGDVVTILAPSKELSGKLPYVGLNEWRRALDRAECDDPIPLTWGYAITGHKSQGSEWRRVTTFLPGDFTNPHFKKQTRLPDGSNMRFSMRFLYTALARAKQHTTLIVSQ